MFHRLSLSLPLSLVLSLAILSGCTKQIPNTTVDDTPANREVIEFMEGYRHAVEARDVGQMLQMASPLYLDDRGTINADDDLDFEGLREKLSIWSDRVTDVRYEIRYRRVTYHEQKVYVEFRFTASFQIKRLDGEERWSRRIGDHRLVLARIDPEDSTSAYRILAGM